ncbi:MAG: SET domain-containing protein [Planctomycetota bacterium]|nr:SET domain-containing protein [Planctomycetota bacterium]
MSSAVGSLARRNSPTHGQGVYATAPIPRGAAILTMAGQRLTFAQTRDDLRCMQIGPNLYLGETDPADPNAIGDYLNHSCDPNVGFTQGTLTLHALRDIAPGEEIRWDYSTSMNEPGWRFDCLCGAGRCRGAVRSFCDLTPAEQDRLRPIALNYLRRGG